MLYPFELRALNDLRKLVTGFLPNFTLMEGRYRSRDAALVSRRFIALVTSAVETIVYRSNTLRVLMAGYCHGMLFWDACVYEITDCRTPQVMNDKAAVLEPQVAGFAFLFNRSA
jgi:hypothetical protein